MAISRNAIYRFVTFPTPLRGWIPPSPEPDDPSEPPNKPEEPGEPPKKEGFSI